MAAPAPVLDEAIRHDNSHTYVGNYTLTSQDLTLASSHVPSGPLDMAPRPTTLKLEAIGSGSDANGTVHIQATKLVDIRGGAEGTARLLIDREGLALLNAKLPEDTGAEALVEVSKQKIKLSVGPLAFVQVEPKEIALTVGPFSLRINGNPGSDCGITLKVNDQKVQLKIDEVAISGLAASLKAAVIDIHGQKVAVKP